MSNFTIIQIQRRFFSENSSERRIEALGCKETDIVYDIPKMDRVSVPILASAQACVLLALENRW